MDNFQIRFLAIALALGFSCATVKAAAGKWILTTADFKSMPVTLLGVDASGLKVAAADDGEAQRVVPLNQFLDISRSLPAVAVPAKFTLHLTGGDKLGGEPVNLTAEALVWKNATLGEISIPTAGLVGITRASAASEMGASDQGREDVIALGNGDVVRGIIASMSGQSATVQTTGGANSEVPLDSVATISFAATPGSAPPRHGFRVRIDEGSSLVGSDARLQADSLVLTFGKGVERKIPLAHISMIEQVNGPVSWMSSHSPSEAIYYPFIGPARQPAAFMDRAFGSPVPIEFKGRLFPHAIGVHAYSRLVWAIEPGFTSFRTRYAIEGESSLADVTVRIKLDDKVVYEQQHVHGGVLSAPVVQDLNGAKTLTLEVDGGAAYAQDALDWIEPALLKSPEGK